MNAVVEMPSRLPALAAGAQVGAIIPRSIEEMWRVSTMVVRAGLAPQALVGKKTGEEATSAVAIAVMAGAELGLPPMVALRSFTVIGGRPALYGDGLINVARRSKKAAYIRTGYDEAGRFGWCEAKRADTGEEKRVEFSEADARAAALWDERKTVRRKNFKTNQDYDAPNDAPWFRYPKRMLAWRAAGYCLRELFADVLGGIADEFEAREVAAHDEPIDVTPPSPPRPPSPTQQQIAAPVEEAEVVEPTEIVVETGEAVESIQDGEPFEAADYFEELETQMAGAMDAATVEEVWTAMDPEGTFDGDDLNLEIAHKIKVRRLTQIHPINAG